MTDSHQAIYEAVRSRISSASTADVIERAAREAFDISHIKPHLQQEIYSVSAAMQRPSVLYRPDIFLDGNKWCALYGEDLQEGVAGFGDTPAAAMAAFDEAWTKPREVDGAPYCSYGHKTKASCDCGPIAENE